MENDSVHVAGGKSERSDANRSNGSVPLAMPLLMTAGACFMEPDEGDLRIVRGPVQEFDPDNPAADGNGWVSRPGFLVQEYGPRYSNDGFELCGGGVWRTTGPLDNFPELLRSLSESDRAALAKATGEQP